MNLYRPIQRIATVQHFLLLLLTVVFLSACHKKITPSSNKDDGAYQEKIKKLNQELAPFKNSGKDSLGLLAEDLILLAAQHHDTANLIEGKIWKANYELRNSNYPMVMKNALSALNMTEATNRLKSLPDIYNLIGNAYKENDYYKGAIPAARKGLKTAQKLKDTSLIIGALLDYAMFTHSYSMKKKDDSLAKVSLKLYMKGLHLAQTSSGNEALETAFLDDISQYYKLEKDFKNGIYYGEKGVALAHKLHRKRSLTYSLNWLGEMYYYQGQHKKGIRYLDSALHYAQALKWPFRVAEIKGSLYECYQSTGHAKKALANIVQSQVIRDSLQMLKNVRQVGLLQVQYETGKKEQKIAMLGQINNAKAKEAGIFLVIMVLFLVLAVFLTFQYRGIRRRNKLLKERNEQINKQTEKLNILMKELHHRVKNNLQIVSGLLSIQSNHLTDQDAVKAVKSGRQRIEAMALIHRSLYKQENPHLINIKDYVTRLLENLFFEFGINQKEFNLQIDIELQELDVDIALPLGLIINEWMTNVFKYAFLSVDFPALSLSLRKERQIILKIKDNGIGMDRRIWEHPKDSFGIKLIKVLAKQIEGLLEMENKEGTLLRLSVPVDTLQSF